MSYTPDAHPLFNLVAIMDWNSRRIVVASYQTHDGRRNAVLSRPEALEKYIAHSSSTPIKGRSSPVLIPIDELKANNIENTLLMSLHGEADADGQCSNDRRRSVTPNPRNRRMLRES